MECFLLCVSFIKFLFAYCFLKFFPFYFLKAIDEPRADLSESFFVGQSVRANIVDVCEL